MFKPSTAPRWKMATRIFLRVSVTEPGADWAYKDRDNHAGMEPTPNIASAEPFRKTRLDAIYVPLFAYFFWKSGDPMIRAATSAGFLFLSSKALSMAWRVWGDMERNISAFATSLGSSPKRATSTLTLSTWFCASCSAKFMRPRNEAEFTHSAFKFEYPVGSSLR